MPPIALAELGTVWSHALGMRLHILSPVSKLLLMALVANFILNMPCDRIARGAGYVADHASGVSLWHI